MDFHVLFQSLSICVCIYSDCTTIINSKSCVVLFRLSLVLPTIQGLHLNAIILNVVSFGFVFNINPYAFLFNRSFFVCHEHIIYIIVFSVGLLFCVGCCELLCFRSFCFEFQFFSVAFGLYVFSIQCVT